MSLPISACAYGRKRYIITQYRAFAGYGKRGGGATDAAALRRDCGRAGRGGTLDSRAQPCRWYGGVGRFQDAHQDERRRVCFVQRCAQGDHRPGGYAHGVRAQPEQRPDYPAGSRHEVTEIQGRHVRDPGRAVPDRTRHGAGRASPALAGLADAAQPVFPERTLSLGRKERAGYGLFRSDSGAAKPDGRTDPAQRFGAGYGGTTCGVAERSQTLRPGVLRQKRTRDACGYPAHAGHGAALLGARESGEDRRRGHCLQREQHPLSCR